MQPEPRRDLFRLNLTIMIIWSLVGLSIWIMRPFLPALIWATMVAVATWPMMIALQARVGKRRWLAVTIMTSVMALVFIVPFVLAIGTLLLNFDDIAQWVKSFDVQALQTPPQWVVNLPVIGVRIDEAWRELAASGDLSEKVGPYIAAVLAWVLGQLGGLGSLILQLILTVGITALLYVNGETAASAVLRFARRVGDERAEGSVILASQAIRGVALGVVVTAIAQSVLGGIGLAIVGVPYSAVLTALMFMLAVAQIGAGPVLICATIWVFWKGDTGWGIALLVWTIIVSAMDNVLRPVLIKRGADLPLLLIFSGVIGGLMAFGLVGIFIGPIVLAVSYTLVAAWMDQGLPDANPPQAASEAAQLRR